VTHTSAPPRRDRTHYLYIAVIVAVIAGVVVGLVAPTVGEALKPVGTAFVNLIKMMISPVIFCTIVLGIGSIRQAAKVGRVGGLALGYFLTMSTIALVIGLVVGNIVQPGMGLDIGGLETYNAPEGESTSDFLMGIIPTTLFSPLVGDSVLSTLFVALLVGFGVQALGRSGEPILRGVKHVERLVFRVLAMIMWVAPIGAFGAIAAVVGSTGWSAVVALFQVMLGFYVTCALFVFVVLGTLLRFAAGINIFSLLRYLGREFLLIVSTSSSESALPRLIAKMEHVGISRPVVGITVPTGYSFNLDGTAIYLTMDRRADLAAAVHDHRVEGRRGRHRRRARHPCRRARLAPARSRRRRRHHRRDRPVHVRGPGRHQLRRQRGRHRPDRALGRRVRPREGRPCPARRGPLRRGHDARRRGRGAPAVRTPAGEGRHQRLIPRRAAPRTPAGCRPSARDEDPGAGGG
jgi:Na+/H+-dicarboxylate symporter